MDFRRERRNRHTIDTAPRLKLRANTGIRSDHVTTYIPLTNNCAKLDLLRVTLYQYLSANAISAPRSAAELPVNHFHHRLTRREHT